MRNEGEVLRKAIVAAKVGEEGRSTWREYRKQDAAIDDDGRPRGCRV